MKINLPSILYILEHHIELQIAAQEFCVRLDILAEVIMPHFKEISNPNRVHRLKRAVV
jgi:hypothetical protein